MVVPLFALVGLVPPSAGLLYSLHDNYAKCSSAGARPMIVWSLGFLTFRLCFSAVHHMRVCLLSDPGSSDMEVGWGRMAVCISVQTFQHEAAL